jgi:hypothetical protein
MITEFWLGREGPLATSRRRWGDNIRLNLGSVDWIHLAQDRTNVGLL